MVASRALVSVPCTGGYKAPPPDVQQPQAAGMGHRPHLRRCRTHSPRALQHSGGYCHAATGERSLRHAYGADRAVVSGRMCGRLVQPQGNVALQISNPILTKTRAACLRACPPG